MPESITTPYYIFSIYIQYLECQAYTRKLIFGSALILSSEYLINQAAKSLASGVCHSFSNDKIFDVADQLTADATYASAWALFYYLAEYHHEQLFDYIYELSLRISSQPYDQSQRCSDFEKYFGKINQIEENWRIAMSNQVLTNTNK